MKLKWDDIDFRSRQITISETKAGETQYQPMGKDRAGKKLKAFEAFRRLKEMPRDISGDVFYWINQFNSDEKTPNYSNLRYAWEKYCREAGIKKCRWHDLRHTYASRMVIAGVNIVVVKELMRHSDIRVTMRYIHLAPKNLDDALSKLESEYDKPDNWQDIDTQVPSEMPSTGTVND